MLTKKQANQIVRARITAAFPDFTRSGPASDNVFARGRGADADLVVVPMVHWRDVQKITLVVGIRFGAVEAIYEPMMLARHPGEFRANPLAATVTTAIRYFAGGNVEWTCDAPAALEAAFDEIDARYAPRFREHFARYADPAAVLADVDAARGPYALFVGDDVELSIRVLILCWIHDRARFDARLEHYRRKYATAAPEVLAAIELAAADLRRPPEPESTS